MDKTLKRNIGYKKSKITTPVVVKPKEVVVDVPRASPAKDIVEWIKAHPWIAWGRMCIELGLDKGNFKRTMDSENPSIKAEIIIKIETGLKNYGYLNK